MRGQPARILTVPSASEMLRSAEEWRSEFFNDALLLVQDAQIGYDRAYISKVVMGDGMKKLSSNKGVTRNPIAFNGEKLYFDTNHGLFNIIKDEKILYKTVYEFREIENQLKFFSIMFFYNFGKMIKYYATFRFTKTQKEGMHFDNFYHGKKNVFTNGIRTFKVFLNVDKKPRVWRVGPDLGSFIKAAKSDFPTPMPNDVNTFCYVVDKMAYLEEFDFQEVEIPPGGMIIGNGTTAAHEVVSGDRMICLEAYFKSVDPAKPFLSEQEYFSQLALEEDLSVAPDFPGLSEISKMPGSLEREIAKRGK